MHIGVTYNNFLISCNLVCYEIQYSGRLLLTFYVKICTATSDACNLACSTHTFLNLLPFCGFCSWLIHQWQQRQGVSHIGLFCLPGYGFVHLLLGQPMFQLLVGLCSCTALVMHVSFILNKHVVYMCRSLISYIDSFCSSFPTNMCVCVCVCVYMYMCYVLAAHTRHG